MHFDHERIPERVVHARGAGAHGKFVSYGNAVDHWARRLSLSLQAKTGTAPTDPMRL